MRTASLHCSCSTRSANSQWRRRPSTTRRSHEIGESCFVTDAVRGSAPTPHWHGAALLSGDRLRARADVSETITAPAPAPAPCFGDGSRGAVPGPAQVPAPLCRTARNVQGSGRARRAAGEDRTKGGQDCGSEGGREEGTGRVVLLRRLWDPRAHTSWVSCRPELSSWKR